MGTADSTPPIDRRDFIAGIAATALTASLSAAPTAGRNASAASISATPPQDAYPPALTGLRGQYPGSFEAAHAVRDGKFGGLDVEDTGESYDLVVVGAGISGLAAAHFFRKALGEGGRILILDNHDDFGGHAKRNEFHHDGRLYLAYGGTMSIETPFPYSFTAKALIEELGIDVAGIAKREDSALYAGLKRGIFFDREHFIADRLVSGAGERPWPEFFASAPLAPEVRRDLIRLHTESVDYLQGMSDAEKVETLKHLSYGDFLARHAKLLPQSLPFFAGMGFRNNMRLDTCPAYTAARSGAVGFQGLKLPADPMFDSGYECHFPDGNATIARLLVSRLIPAVFPGRQSVESVTTAAASYAALDSAASATRIRLKSTVIRVEHSGPTPAVGSVRVVYQQNGRARRVVADSVIMACFNNIIPYVVPDLPEAQKQALHYASKVPMQYTNVLVRNWQPWKRLGISQIQAPNGYHTWVALDIPVSLGSYRFPSNPDEPIVVHMVRNPNAPGLPRREQHRAGRASMLATSFEQIEHEIRSQLGRMLGPGGFDEKRDILGITVNRWPHGYAYTYDTLGDPDLPEAERPHVLGRRPFGRITIANADSGAAAFTNTAIDQAERAVQECLYARGLT